MNNRLDSNNNNPRNFKTMSLKELFEYVHANLDGNASTKPAELELVNRVLELLKAPTLPDYYVSSNLNINMALNAMLANMFINLTKKCPLQFFTVLFGGEQNALLVKALAEYGILAQTFSRKEHGISCPFVVIDPYHKGIDLVPTPKQN